MKKQFHSTKFPIIPTYPGVADKTYLYRIEIILLQETNESSNFLIRVYFLIFFFFYFNCRLSKYKFFTNCFDFTTH